MKNKGVTLISLVITIIVILILITVTAYNGANTVKSSKFKVFETKLKIMQSEVNSLYDNYKSGGLTQEIINQNTKPISDASSTAALSNVGVPSADYEKYRYFDQKAYDYFGIKGVEGETYFVNIDKRHIVSCNGFEYEGKTYYEITEFVNDLYNVEYNGFDNQESSEDQDEDEETGEEETSTYPKFDLSVNYMGNEKWLLNVHNIRYSGNINRWYVKYGLVGKDGKVSNWYTSDNYSFEVNKEGLYKVKIVNGNIKSKLKKGFCYVTLSNIITKANYGEYVNYKIDGINGDWNNDGTVTDDWRILYNDGKNVFIIASDCVPNDDIDLTKVKANKASNCKYRINWSSTLSMQNVDENILNKFKASQYTLKSNNINSKCAATLLNAENWENYVNTDYAEYAIGSPTIEMLTDSWNELGYDGITVGTGTQGYTASGNLSFNCTDANLKTLYVPHAGWYSPTNESAYGFYGYWIASPADSNGCLWSEYSGYLNGYYYGNSANGVRPVIMLKSNVLGEKDPDTGVWNLQKGNIESYYSQKGNEIFDGTNYINTEMYLFNEENVNKDFEVSFDIINRNSTGGQATMVNSMDESGTPWPGFVYKIESGDKFKVNATANTEDKKEVINPSNTVSKVIIKRKGGVIYLNINDTTDELVLDMKNLAKTFNVPVTFGASLKGNGDPQRFFNGTLSNLKIIIYSN